jgi:hypothetical protein
MANKHHVSILQKGVQEWNAWRTENPDIKPDLRKANLANLDLRNANLISVNLSGAVLDHAILQGAKFRGAKLDGTSLYKSDLSNADLHSSSLCDTNLSEASLLRANLCNTHFQGANVTNSDFSGSHIGETVFTDLNLSTAKGLDQLKHYGPSSIDLDTLYRSAGHLSQEFLRGCGVPDDFIAFMPSHFGIQKAIQFYSCFISYSTKDEQFVKRLHSRLREEHLRVWFAPEDIKAGQKLNEQIERAIQLHDRLLLVLSENSIQSEWVITEIRNARRVELQEGRRKLFPIRLVDFELIKSWKCFDSETGKDLAVEVREYFIPDFSKWKNHDDFEAAFKRLMRDLRAEEGKYSRA